MVSHSPALPADMPSAIAASEVLIDLREGNGLRVSGRLHKLERKSLGLLAYLALHGPTPRSTLTGLLWPATPDRAARNNLAQVVRRLKMQAGVGVVSGTDSLALASGIEVALPGVHTDPPDECAWRFLAHADYADCSKFDAWLRVQRQTLRRHERQRGRAALALAEAQGQLRSALGIAIRLQALDPLSETATRDLMRLRYLLGDSAAALDVYGRLKARLRKELGTLPSRTTEYLLRDILQGQQQAAPIALARPRLALLRPPLLIGREEDWQRMEDAWAAGQGVFITGPAGIGKSRLMHDFLASKGRHYLFEGRPSDFAIPYATHSRTYAEKLRAFPNLNLPDWVRQELSRIVPGLSATPLPPPREEDKLRFLQAKLIATNAAIDAGMRHVGIDDMQFIDPHSLEAGHYVYAHHWGRTDGARSVICYRDGDLLPDAEAALDQIVAAGRSVRIHLAPLPATAAARLVDSLGLDFAVDIDLLMRRSGGNPLFLLETLKAWASNDDPVAAQRQPQELPMHVLELLRLRLGQLSQTALDLARIAALAGPRFSPELAATVLGLPGARLTGPWAELERAQILTGPRITHEALADALVAGLPEPVSTSLERTLAAHLAT